MGKGCDEAKRTEGVAAVRDLSVVRLVSEEDEEEKEKSLRYAPPNEKEKGQSTEIDESDAEGGGRKYVQKSDKEAEILTASPVW